MQKKRVTQVDVYVGNLIRIYRVRAGLTQTQLAEKAGVSFQQIQKYEKGVNRVGVGRLTSIARALKVPITAFFESTDSPAQLEQRQKDWLALLADEGSFRLLRAFSKIVDPEVQRLFILLIEAVIAPTRPTARSSPCVRE